MTTTGPAPPPRPSRTTSGTGAHLPHLPPLLVILLVGSGDAAADGLCVNNDISLARRGHGGPRQAVPWQVDRDDRGVLLPSGSTISRQA